MQCQILMPLSTLSLELNVAVNKNLPSGLHSHQLVLGASMVHTIVWNALQKGGMSLYRVLLCVSVTMHVWTQPKIDALVGAMT